MYRYIYPRRPSSPKQASVHRPQMEVRWQEWLKGSYLEAPVEGPDAKHVKFSTILVPSFPQIRLQWHLLHKQCKSISQLPEKADWTRETHLHSWNRGCSTRGTATVAGSSTQQELQVTDTAFSGDIRTVIIQCTQVNQ